MMQKENSQSFSFQKYLIQFYFVLFIILNIFDFINALPEDIDFLKKILSWTIIGYIFYKTSFTKIFIGEKLKIYDLLFIFAFSLMSITKNLLTYAKGSENIAEYVIFNPIISFLRNLPFNETVFFTFILGSIISIIISISLILNHKIKEESFLGSLKLKDTYFAFVLNLFSLLLLVSFFSLIIFNFFMEWFALAVDALILVLGLIYYFITYLHKHTNHNISEYLREVSNTGNQFYSKIISLFSNKKTFFIGISFILTLHLIVDAGVYLVPYSIGTENALYFDALDVNGREHTPLFNLFDIRDSQLYQDLILLTTFSQDYFSVTLVILFYLLTLVAYGLLLISPFYFFYKNIRHKEVSIPSPIVLLSILGFLSLFLLQALPEITPPIDMSTPETLSIKGVDLHTTSLLSSSISQSIFSLYIAFLILQLIFILLVITYDKISYFVKKLLVFVSLIFFITYISLFYVSFIESELAILDNTNQNILSSQMFDESYDIYLNPNFYTNDRKSNSIIETDENLNYSVYAFSTYDGGKYHKDYFYIEIENPGNSKLYKLQDSSARIFYSIDSSPEKLMAIYYVGENVFIFEEGNLVGSNEIYTLNLRSSEYKESSLDSLIDNMNENLAIFRIILASFFYILGGLTFVFYFFRRNIIRDSF